MNKYIKYENITKELLDSIEVGDLIKVNDWKKPLRVRAVSDNYFVMATKVFGKWDYSVCEKQPWGGTRYNSMVGGMFHVGTDNWVFGAPIWTEFNEYGEYDFDNIEATQAYVNSFEKENEYDDGSELSVRTSVPIYSIEIKKYKPIAKGVN